MSTSSPRKVTYLEDDITTSRNVNEKKMNWINVLIVFVLKYNRLSDLRAVVVEEIDGASSRRFSMNARLI